MTPLLTVVPLAVEARRGPVGVVVADGALTWTPIGTAGLTAAALAAAAEHFGLPLPAVEDTTAIGFGRRSPGLVAASSPFTDREGRLRLVCALFLRRRLNEWTLGAAVGRAVAWQHRDPAAFAGADAQAVAAAVETARELLRRTPLATLLAGPLFGLGDLRAIYDDLWDTRVDPPNFQRRFTAPGARLLEEYPVVEVADAAAASRLPLVPTTETASSTAGTSWAYSPGNDPFSGPGRRPRIWVPGRADRIEPPLQVPPNAGWRPSALGPATLPPQQPQRPAKRPGQGRRKPS